MIAGSYVVDRTSKSAIPTSPQSWTSSKTTLFIISDIRKARDCVRELRAWSPSSVEPSASASLSPRAGKRELNDCLGP